MARLAGKHAIVTGGGRGIGAGIARAFGLEGAAVAVVDCDGVAARAVAVEIEDAGGRALPLELDVADEDQVAGLAESVLGAFGSIDVLVNNAGFTRHAEVVDMTLAQWHDVLLGNLTPVFLCSRAVLPTMIERRSGSIVNTGSQLGYLGAPTLAHYTAAKSGIHGFTKALAREVAEYGIRVNAFAPGPVETENLLHSPPEMLDALRLEIPLRRFARVEEIAPTVVLLASDEGSYYTGSIVNVSGGHLML
jgi:3-oxoacyl-[acyl-carrier protein] reductase